MQVKFMNESHPKLLPLSDFVTDQGSYFSRFETCSIFRFVERGCKTMRKKVEGFRIQVVKTVLLGHPSDPSLPRRGSHQLHLQPSN